MEITRVGTFDTPEELAQWLTAQAADGFALRSLVVHRRRLVAVVVKGERRGN
jgi:hypothetical protein